MDCPLPFSDDLLTPEERTALAAVAEQLWEMRDAISARWSMGVDAEQLDASAPGEPLSSDNREATFGTMLTLVLASLRAGDLNLLTDRFYMLARHAMRSTTPPTGRLDRSVLTNVYLMAQHGLRSATAALSNLTLEQMAAYSKLRAHLLMLVGLAYNDLREEEMERARNELERIIEERTAALAREKALAETIIETLPGLFFVIDSHERLARWNHEVERVSGYSAAELARRHPLDFFDREARPMLAQKMRRAFDEGEATAEADFVARDGSRHPRWFTGRMVELAGEPALVAIGFDTSERRRAAEQVEVQNQLASGLIESLPGIFYLFDETGRFLRWNRNFEIVAQRSADEIANMHPLDFFDVEGRQVIAERINEVFDTGQATAEANFVSKDGTTRPYFFTGRRLRLGDKTWLLGMGLDITERKQTEDALQRARTTQLFGALLESAPDAMVVSDRNANIVFVNSTTQRLFGYTRDALQGRSISLLIPDELHERPRPTGVQPLTTTVEAEGRRRDGSRFPVEMTLSPFESADGVLLITSIRDVTERQRAEAKIRHLNADLERRVEHRTRELARSNADLEQFAYVASHDLQEPLRAVASYTQFLVRRYSDRLDGEALRFIDRTVSAVTRMQALIRDLLAYSRVGTKGEAFSAVDCESVLTDVLDDLQTTISETGAMVTHDPLPVIPGDRSQLHQLLQNLIGNAMKFRAHDRPLVHIAAQRDADAWLFTVQDNGIGIEPEFTERVFVIFQRLHSRRKYPGTGVGLAICKRIVERHGGQIWVEPGTDQGTCMCFQLPAEIREEQPAAAVNQ